jgi:nicotinate-nucleotide pyrophosphorylase (carboxylating)
MTISKYYKKYNLQINNYIRLALMEDKIKNDVTSNYFWNDNSKIVKSYLLCKEDCTLAGIGIFKKVLNLTYRNFKIGTFFKDGSKIKKGDEVLSIRGPVNMLLKCERVALNYLQRMSGIATLTSEFVSKLRFKNSKILHTRKTTPNFRLFELLAVKIGGGYFHRFDLSSSLMIKDNHIASFGNVKTALEKLNKISNRDILKNNVIEVKNLNEIDDVIKYGKGLIKIVMLDNFNRLDIVKAVRILKRNNFKIELSGGINFKNFSRIQRKNIDFYSIGMITHSYKSVDFSLEI